MSDVDTYTRVAAYVAGVSLHRPQLWYRAKQPWGTAVLLRASQDSRLEHATLRLELAPEAAARHALAGDPAAVDKVRFAMKDWLTARNPAGRPNDPEGQAAWRALLVEHGLLSHPELILAGAEVQEAPPTPLPTKVMDDSCAQALEKLRRRFESLVAVREPSARGYPVRCEACLQLDEERRRSAQGLPSGGRPLPRSRWAWDRVAEARPDCDHVPLAASALQALCKSSPELLFELLGLLVPEGSLMREQPGQRPAHESRRFVLEPGTQGLLLKGWFLPERAQGARRWPAQGHERARRERRNFRLSAAARQAQAGSTLSAGLRAGVSFAAAAWGIELPIEQLAWRSLRGDDAAPARQPVFDVKARDVLDVPRFLPDVVPLQEPRPESEAPRRRASERGTARPRAGQVRRRAK